MARRASARDERGAVLVMAVLLMTVVLTFTAFAVDLGTQRVARRDMQSLADAAAMDLARVIKGRTADAVLSDPAWPRVKQQAVAQNKTTVGSSPVLTPVLGKVDLTTGAFTPVSGGSFPTAVRVIATTSVGFAFVPGEGGAARSAIASSADPALCFSVSPTALTVDTTTGGLAPLLKNILKAKFQVLSPDGLLTVRGIQVPLADIAVELGAVTPQEVLNLSNVSLQSFVVASAKALTKNGRTAEATALQAIAAQVVGPAYVNVGKILNLDAANAAGLAAKVDVFDLVTGAVFAANGTNSVDVQGVAVGLPGVGGVQDLSVKITEPPQIACGKAGIVAKGAQVRLHLKSKIDPLGIGATDVGLDLDLDLGRGEGELKSITCGAAKTATIRAASGGAVAVATLSLKLILGLVTLTEPLKGLVAGGGPTDLTFTVPDGNASAAPQSISGSNVLKLEPVGLLGTVAGQLLNGPVNTLLSGLLYPVLNLLGIKIAQTDVKVHGNIDCNTVKLVG